MKTKLLLFCVAWLSLAAQSFAQSACFLAPISMEQRVKQSEVIIQGKVYKQECYWTSTHARIMTRNFIKVEAVLKGLSNVPQEVIVITEGGFKDGMGMTYTNTLSHQNGDRGIWLLNKTEEANTYNPYASLLGFMRINDDGISDAFGKVSASFHELYAKLSAMDAQANVQLAKDYVAQEIAPKPATGFGKKAIVDFTPTTIFGGMGQVLTINGSGFGTTRNDNYVAFYLETGSYSSPEAARGYKYLSWSDTKIEMEMPVAFSGTVKVIVNGTTYESSATLKVKVNVGAIKYSPLDYDYLYNQNGNGGYTWTMHADLWNNPAAKAAIEDVFKEFRCKTGVNYKLANTSTNKRFDLGDNVQSIAFDTIGQEMAPGTVARYEQGWASCILGTDTLYYVYAQDMRISHQFDWYYGTGAVPSSGKPKLRYVLFHEFGHSLQFGHVNEEGQSMYPQVTGLPSENWSARDSITTEERIAGSYFVQKSMDFTFNACGVSHMLALTDCNSVYTGLKENDLQSKYNLSVFPNPVSDYVVINSDKTLAGGTYQLFDIFGREVANGTVTTGTTISVNHLSGGVYFLNVSYQGMAASFKIIKQ